MVDRAKMKVLGPDIRCHVLSRIFHILNSDIIVPKERFNL